RCFGQGAFGVYAPGASASSQAISYGTVVAVSTNADDSARSSGHFEIVRKRTIMSAYVVFTRTKTIDQKELEKYWAGSQATMKGHPIEVLAAFGKHEVLEGDPIEGIVIVKFPNAK